MQREKQSPVITSGSVFLENLSFILSELKFRLICDVHLNP